MPDRQHRDFLAIPDFTAAELGDLFDLAARMKCGDYEEKPLAGKTLGMIFAKSSTRTRVSFEVGAYQLGGHALPTRGGVKIVGHLHFLFGDESFHLPLLQTDAPAGRATKSRLGEPAA